MAEQRADPSSERRVADKIFVVSAAMVGVCLTLMGLVAILSSLQEVATVTEELLAADAMVFLVACLASYFSLRTPTERAAQRYARIADVTFIGAMVAIVVIGAVVAMRLV